MAHGFLLNRRHLLGALATTMASPALALAGRAETPFPMLQATVDRYVRDGLAPHMLVAIGGRDGPPTYLANGTHSIGSGPPVGPESLYYLASMTKPITAFAVMALVEDGKLSLDTPLAEIYPTYARLQVLTDPESSLETRPAANTMTIRHIVTHSSGFGASFNVTGPLKSVYDDESASPFRRYPAGTKPPQTSSLDKFAMDAASIPLLFEPGSSWRYSMGFDIAVAIVEKLADMPYWKFVQQRLLTPLGMHNTFYTVPPDKRARLAKTYLYSPDGLQLPPPERQDFVDLALTYPTGGGGLVSSASDYCRFCAMLLNEGELDGVRVMHTDTVRLMMSDLMEQGVPAPTSYGTGGHGAGGRLTIVDDPTGEGIGTYGWGGAANTMFWVDRTRGIYFLIMTQIAQWYPNPLYRDFRKALYADLADR